MEQEVQSFLDDPMLDKHLERHEAWDYLLIKSNDPSELQKFGCEVEDFLSTQAQDYHPFWVGMAYIARLHALGLLTIWWPVRVQPDRLRAAATEVQSLPESLKDFNKVLKNRIWNDSASKQERRIRPLHFIMIMSHKKVKFAEDHLRETARATDRAYAEAMAAVQNRMASHSIQEDMDADEAMDAEED